MALPLASTMSSQANAYLSQNKHKPLLDKLALPCSAVTGGPECRGFAIHTEVNTKMKLNQILSALVGAGLLGLMSAPAMARSTAGDLGTAVNANPPLVLAQETPAQQNHEQQRYDEQMREDQHQHHNQQTAMRHSKHHRWHHYSHKLHKQPIHNEAGDNMNAAPNSMNGPDSTSGHDAH
jgi:hypothetical protein